MTAPQLPADDQPHRLTCELVALFRQFAFIHRILAFGSLARGDCDRWSDVDLLVVCAGGPAAYWHLLEQLSRAKPVIHRGRFCPSLEPTGSAVLGIVFAGESIFSILDLNFLSPDGYAKDMHRQRFGPFKELYAAGDPQDFVAGLDLLERVNLHEEEDAVEVEIWAAMHFLHKSLRKFLRGQCPTADPKSHQQRLAQVLNQYPEHTTARGNIRQVAQDFFTLSRSLVPDP